MKKQPLGLDLPDNGGQNDLKKAQKSARQKEVVVGILGFIGFSLLFIYTAPLITTAWSLWAVGMFIPLIAGSISLFASNEFKKDLNGEPTKSSQRSVFLTFAFLLSIAPLLALGIMFNNIHSAMYGYVGVIGVCTLIASIGAAHMLMVWTKDSWKKEGRSSVWKFFLLAFVVLFALPLVVFAFMHMNIPMYGHIVILSLFVLGSISLPFFARAYQQTSGEEALYQELKKAIKEYKKTLKEALTENNTFKTSKIQEITEKRKKIDQLEKAHREEIKKNRERGSLLAKLLGFLGLSMIGLSMYGLIKFDHNGLTNPHKSPSGFGLLLSTILVGGLVTAYLGYRYYQGVKEEMEAADRMKDAYKDRKDLDQDIEIRRSYNDAYAHHYELMSSVDRYDRAIEEIKKEGKKVTGYRYRLDSPTNHGEKALHEIINDSTNSNGKREDILGRVKDPDPDPEPEPDPDPESHDGAEPEPEPYGGGAGKTGTETDAKTTFTKIKSAAKKVGRALKSPMKAYRGTLKEEPPKLDRQQPPSQQRHESGSRRRKKHKHKKHKHKHKHTHTRTHTRTATLSDYGAYNDCDYKRIQRTVEAPRIPSKDDDVGSDDKDDKGKDFV